MIFETGMEQEETEETEETISRPASERAQDCPVSFAKPNSSVCSVSSCSSPPVYVSLIHSLQENPVKLVT